MNEEKEIPEVSEAVVNAKELEIIDFINDLQLQYESEIQEKISKQVVDKFGDIGKKVISDLSTEVEINHAEDCPDCGKVSEEWLEKSKKRMELMEIFLDDTLEDVANQIIMSSDGYSKIPKEKIEKAIVAKPEIKDKVKVKIMFMGIEEGWLECEIFE